MIVLPVLDILHGQVVRGVGGERQDYRPIISRLTGSTHPIVVANAIRDEFCLDRFYIADLDGILYERPNLALYKKLIDDGFELLVDAGLGEPGRESMLIDAGVNNVIVGLESCRSPEELTRITACCPNVTFSLDLQNGAPLRKADFAGWSDDPYQIVQQAMQAMPKAILVLDLSDVGCATGGTTDLICKSIRCDFPDVHLITGGGVRDSLDLERQHQLRIDAILVASALHDGRLSRDDLTTYRTGLLIESGNHRH